MCKKQKIFIVTTSFPRWNEDNRSPFIFEKAKALVEKGMDVTVVAMHAPGSKTKELIENVKIIRIKYFPEKYEKLQETRAGIPAAWKKNKFEFFPIVLFTLALFFFLIKNKNNFDLIHANWTISAFSAILSKRIHRKPVVTTLHGSDINLVTKNVFFRFLTKFVIEQSDQIVCVSNDLFEKVSKLTKKNPSITIIPNGVNTTLFFPDFENRQKIILFVGSLTKNKNISLLINSFSNRLAKLSNYKLFIVGDGPEEVQLKKDAAEKLPKNNYFFTGSLSRKELSNLMRKSSILVLPSLNEGFGVVLIEAMASGLPCIGSRVGGIVEILENGVGKLFSVKNGLELELALVELLLDTDKYIEMSKKARVIAEKKYDWDIISIKLVNLYSKILNINENNKKNF